MEVNNSKVLLVEDQPDLAHNVQQYLSTQHIECDHAARYSQAIQMLGAGEYDVVLLDIMLPDGNGLDLFNHIQILEEKPGVIIVSAKNSIEDKVQGLDLGADDYMAKPYHLSELNARIKSLIRRKNPEANSKITFNGIEIDTDQHIVIINGQLTEFTVKEQELLTYFLSNKKRVLTKQNIADYLWGDNVDFLDSFDFVYQHIKNIRKKISAAGGPDCIKTIYGLGYKLDQ